MYYQEYIPYSWYWLNKIKGVITKVSESSNDCLNFQLVVEDVFAHPFLRTSQIKIDLLDDLMEARRRLPRDCVLQYSE
jgi:hypothetical protein